jgi:hypothetical protein
MHPISEQFQGLYRTAKFGSITPGNENGQVKRPCTVIQTAEHSAGIFRRDVESFARPEKGV